MSTGGQDPQVGALESFTQKMNELITNVRKYMTGRLKPWREYNNVLLLSVDSCANIGILNLYFIMNIYIEVPFEDFCWSTVGEMSELVTYYSDCFARYIWYIYIAY